MTRAGKTCADGCGRPRSVGPYCAGCARQRDAGRGRRQERGYDRTHERIRRQLLAQLRTAERRGEVVTCPRCGNAVTSTQADRLDAAHSVDLRDDPTARADHLEHAACNRAWRAD